MPAYAKLMIVHALALFGGAAASFLGGGWDAGKTGIIICAVTGLLMLVMALLSAAKAKAALMIGIHGGLVLAALYTLMFGYTAVSRWIKYAGEEGTPFYLPALLTALAVISALVFVGLIRLRPAPGERGAGGGAQTGRPSPEAG